MSKPFAVGIDFGTSTSEICIYRDGRVIPVPDPITRSPIVPSLVAMDERGRVQVGERARARVDEPGYGVREVKRLMGQDIQLQLGKERLRPEEVACLVLRDLKANAEAYLGESITDVVISVPAIFADPARHATKTAGELANLNVLRIVQEPTVAAMAFGIDNLENDEKVAVFDFGGGTLDVSIIEMIAGVLDVQSTFGDALLGGKDFDEVLSSLVEARFEHRNPGQRLLEHGISQLWQAIEDAKKLLSQERNATVRLDHASAVDAGVHLEEDITRAEFEEASAHLLARSREVLDKALRRSKLPVSAIQRVLLVGGSTYMPMVRQLVREFFGSGTIVAKDVDPDLAVASGAAIEAAIIGGLISEEHGLVKLDVSPYGLGIEVVSEVGSQLMLIYDPLIRPNTKVPHTVDCRYHLLHEDQEGLELRLYQDKTGNAQLPADAIDTGIFGRISDIPPSLDGTPHEVQVRFEYGVDGTAELTASIPATGQTIRLDLVFNDGRLVGAELDASRSRLDALFAGANHSAEASAQWPPFDDDAWRGSPLAKRYEMLLKRADEVSSVASPDDSERLASSARRLKSAILENDAVRVEEAADQLTDLIIDIGAEGTN